MSGLDSPDGGYGVYKNLTVSLEPNSAAATLKNKNRLNFASPREEYVETLGRIDPMALCNKWGISPTLMRKVSRDENWGAQRQRFIQEVREIEQRILKGDVADLRIKEAQKNVHLWDALRSVLINLAEKGTTTEMSPTGEKWQRPYDPRAFHDLVKSADVIGKNMNETLKFIRGDDEEETDSVIPTRITQVIYNVHQKAPEELGGDFMVGALPGGTSLPEGIEEAEIVNE